MRGLVLLLSTAVALCWAAPPLEPVTCTGDKQETNAVRFAIQHINDNQDHGYKFQLSEVLANIVTLNTQGCSITMRVNLQETKCHHTNPKDFEDCEVRYAGQTVVMAGCVVTLSVDVNVASVVSYQCQTTKDEEMARTCPDCPTLLKLDNAEGLKNIRAAVSKYNMNNATDHYFVLSDVGRISAGYIMRLGMNYVAEFAMVESHCPVGTRINPEACSPLCADRARHIFCRIADNPRSHTLICDIYPAVNQMALPPGENEPVCPVPQRFNPAVRCTAGPASDAIHSICNWPRPQVPQQGK